VCLLSKQRHSWRHVISDVFVDIIKVLFYSVLINSWIWPTSLQKTSGQHSPTRLPCVGYNASSISQTSVKAKDHPRGQKYIAADLGWLPTDKSCLAWVSLNLCEAPRSYMLASLHIPKTHMSASSDNKIQTLTRRNKLRSPMTSSCL